MEKRHVDQVKWALRRTELLGSDFSQRACLSRIFVVTRVDRSTLTTWPSVIALVFSKNRYRFALSYLGARSRPTLIEFVRRVADLQVQTLQLGIFSVYSSRDAINRTHISSSLS